MDFGDVPAWVAAMVALGSMLVAIVAAVLSGRQVAAARAQADEAKKAREAAEAGVEQARRSAAAAEEQARVAVEQLTIMRDQIAEQRAEQDNPYFDVSRPSFTGEETVPIDIRMIAGTDLRSITISVTGKDVQGFSGDPASEIEGGEPIVHHDVSLGSEVTVWVGLRDTYDNSMVVQIDCEAADGRTWQRQQKMRLMHPSIRSHGH